jgi:hypothetical protein
MKVFLIAKKILLKKRQFFVKNVVFFHEIVTLTSGIVECIFYVKNQGN